MVKPPQKLDIAFNEGLRQEIRNINGDPDFVWFLMGWCGLIGVKEFDLMTEKHSEAYKKRIKRCIKKDHGDDGKSYWKEINTECLNARQDMKMCKGLFKLEPLRANPSHRTPNHRMWMAVFHLREYFIKLTSRPNEKIIGKILFPGKDDYGSINSEWNKRKKWFDDGKDLNGNPLIHIEDLIRFYEVRKDKIMQSLKTGVPIYL